MKAFANDARVMIRCGGEPDPRGEAVVYWMQRAQRAADNPALDVAIACANELAKPCVVFLGIVPFYPRANWRHYDFLVSGLSELAEALARRGVGFVLRRHPEHRLAPFLTEVKAALVIGDENPMNEPRAWREKIAEQVRVPLWTVDADVIVPSRLLLKEQFAARTMRPRIHKLLPDFLHPPREQNARHAWTGTLASRVVDSQFLDGFRMDRTVAPVPGRRGGTKEAMRLLHRFIANRLPTYAEDRNDPSLAGTSQLSAALHYGHIGPRTVALAVRDADAPQAQRDAYLEEFIVRRELAINFVHFNPRYETLASCEPWANKTLTAHALDERSPCYSEQRLEQAESHDPLWNAAQKQMVVSGWMHGYVRMYWAKKILEWSPTPEEAYARAVRLNDKYLLDGRDPNGYAGIAWAIGGKHDRAWGERPVFGKIRFMSYESTRKKFDSKGYIAQIAKL